jgi:hypothetical protein
MSRFTCPACGGPDVATFYEVAGVPVTAGSLHRLFARAGFEVLDLCKTFDDQYLVVEARPAGGRLPDALGPDDIADTLAATKRFITAPRELIDHWRDRIRAAVAGRGTVVWGASSTAVAFLAPWAMRTVTSALPSTSTGTSTASSYRAPGTRSLIRSTYSTSIPSW